MHHARISLYAMMLAAAGIPLYIHLPRFASVNLGIGLGALGTILLLIRLVDLVQDPLIGWSIDRWPAAQLGFALPPPDWPSAFPCCSPLHPTLAQPPLS